MKHNVVAPSVGESVTEVGLLKWHKQNGQAVKVGDVLLEIESDKATVEIVAEHAGALSIGKQAGERFPVGTTLGFIDDSQTGTVMASAPAAVAAPKAAASAALGAPVAPAMTGMPLSPAVRRVVAETGVDPNGLAGTGRGGRLTKGDVLFPQTQAPAARAPQPVSKTPDREGDRRVPMSMLRSRIAERLVEAQHTAAILTTFNEADMSAIMAIRAKQKDAFKAQHGVGLGFMSFFTKAAIASLKLVPEVNASIDGRDTIYHDYYDVGIAVGSDRGLVVPVVRGADQLSFSGLEKKIAELGARAKDGKLSIAELTGGTFTISNGGVYGSLLSTPILNPPQSGILGMHKIQERPVAINGKVEIRPMMYLALSYDHRLIDGKGAVTFLVTLKEHLENPEKLGPIS